MKPLAYITVIWFATAMLVHRADAGQLQPFSVQTQLGTSQVGMTEAQGDSNVVIGVTDGSGKPEVTDSTGQRYAKRFGCTDTLVTFFFPNVQAGYHLIKMTGVSRMVVIEHKGFSVVGASACGGVSFPPEGPFGDLFTFDGGYKYSIPLNCFKNELFVIIQLVNTPGARIAPSFNTEVYDQMGNFVVQDTILDHDPKLDTVTWSGDITPEIREKVRKIILQEINETLFTKQKDTKATVNWITLALRTH